MHENDDEALFGQPAAIPDDFEADRLRAGIEKDLAGRDGGPLDPNFRAGQGQPVAVVEQRHAIAGDAAAPRDLRGGREHPNLPVDGQDSAGLHQREPVGEIVLVRVSRDVNRGVRFAQDLRTAPDEVVGHAVDGPLVTRDRARGKEHAVAAAELQVRVLVEGQAVQRRKGLALASGSQAQDAVRRGFLELARRDPRRCRDPQAAEALRDLRDRAHAPTEHGDLPADRRGGVHGLRHTRHVTREGRQDDPARRALERGREPLSGDSLGERAAGALRVRRVDERQIHPLSDGARDLREVGRLSVGWIRIELEVSGVEDPRAPGLHEEGRGIGN